MSVNEVRIDELKARIAARQVVIIAGAGVAANVSDHPPVRSWVQMIRSGMRHALDHRTDLHQNFEPSVELLLDDPSYTIGLVNAASSVTSALGGHESADFRNWLRLSVGEAKVDRPALIDALNAVNSPILTVNYDSLLEIHTRRTTRTWKEPAEMQAIITGQTKDIGHLHGAWSHPASVVFGGESYGNLTGNASAIAVERAVTSLKTILFVGCGDGLSDPNFDALLRWLQEKLPASAVQHYRLVRDSESDSASGAPIATIKYGSDYAQLAPFVRDLSQSATVTTATTPDTPTATRREIVDRLKQESPFADQVKDLSGRELDELIAPPVILPVTHEQYVAAQRDDDGPKIGRIDAVGDLSETRLQIIVGDESSGLTTTLQWLAITAQKLDPQCSPLVLDYRVMTSLKPIDRSARLAIRLAGASISSSEPLPPLALAVDNLTPSDAPLFNRLIEELPLAAARWTFLGCRPGHEASLHARLKAAGLEPTTRYIGRMGTPDIRAVAVLVAPMRAEQLTSRAVTIIQREHLARTPLTVCLLVSVLLAGEAFLSTASETALLDAYVNLLLGRGGLGDDARVRLDANENSSLLSALAGTYVTEGTGALDESQAIRTFEQYFYMVGWRESATDALTTLIKRHVLVRRNGKIEFSQASLLHLFAAKQAMSDQDLRDHLLSQPLFYADIIKHYAALTRRDRDLVYRADQMVSRMIAASSAIPRSSQLSEQTVETIVDPDELDEVLNRLEQPMFDNDAATTRPDTESSNDEIAESDDPLIGLPEIIVPFPVTPIEDMPPLIQMARTLSLASNILRDSEQVTDLNLKRDALGRLLRLWGQMVDAFAADEDFRDFIAAGSERLASRLDLPDKKRERFIRRFKDLAPLLTSLTGMTLNLSSRKLSLMLQRVMEEGELSGDDGAMVMGALLSHDIHAEEWPSAFRAAYTSSPNVLAVREALEPLANYSYYYRNEREEDQRVLEDFLSDILSSRAGREGSPERLAAKSRVLTRLKRNRIGFKLGQELKSSRKEIEQGPAGEAGPDGPADRNPDGAGSA